jgi:hypothetical protein
VCLFAIAFAASIRAAPITKNTIALANCVPKVLEVVVTPVRRSVVRVSVHPTTRRIQNPGMSISTPRIESTFAGLHSNF